VQSAFGHAGQKCSAASLAIVERSIYENPSFIRQLTDAVESLAVGPGYELASSVGPIIRPAERRSSVPSPSSIRERNGWSRPPRSTRMSFSGARV